MSVSPPVRILPDPKGCRIHLRVVPGARVDAIDGPFGERLRVRVRAAPERGKANRAVEDLLAGTLGIPASRVEVLAGHGSRDKTVLIHGLTPERIRDILQLS